MDTIFSKLLIGLALHGRIMGFGLISLILGLVLSNYITFEKFFVKTEIVIVFVQQHKFLAVLIYLIVYFTVVMFSIPVASILTAVGGYAFGGIQGGIIAFFGAVLGSSALFLIVASGLKLNSKSLLLSNPLFAKLSQEIFDNEFRYLLLLRFFPLFPFWMVNLVPAILGVKFKVFFFSTFFGIIPGTFLISFIGEKARIFSEPEAESFSELISNPAFFFLFLIFSFITIYPRLARYKIRKK